MQKANFLHILKYLFSYIEKWYWDGKVLETMAGVDLEVKKLHEQWDADDKQITPHTVETGVFGEEGWSIQISNPIVHVLGTHTSAFHLFNSSIGPNHEVLVFSSFLSVL